MTHKSKIRRSFTLVELMCAMAVIAILAGLGVKGMQYANLIAAENATKAYMAKVSTFLENFKKKYGYYPQQSGGDMNLIQPLRDASGTAHLSSVEDLLAALIDDYTSEKNSDFFSTSNARYDSNGDGNTNNSDDEEVSKVSFTDGFGQNFYYKCPGEKNMSSYDLWSKGANGMSDVDGNDKEDNSTNNGGLTTDQRNGGSDDVNLDNITNWE